MNPIEIIKADHKKVESLFKKYEELGDKAFKTKKDLAMEIMNELSLHAEMEETILYPVLKDRFNKEGDKMVEEAYAEHGVAKDLIAELESLDPGDPQFDAKIKVLNENIDHHVKEEEEELLPRAEKELAREELEDIGRKMKEFKDEEAKE
ncbi:MAG: hemerythrin [Candidatus Nomurabacteria bacterium]|nr:hemerythrin [Candidatus Nomurabacteria bacterium]